MAVTSTRIATPPAGPRPLVVTAELDLLDDVLRLSADAGVLVDVAPDPAAARPWYPRAPLVLIGIDAAPGCLRAGLPRRAGVVLMGRHEGDAPPAWDVAEQLGAEYVAALPAGEAWLRRRLAEADRHARTGSGLRGSGEAHVIAVVGGRGGAGATVLATALAVTAARRGMRTLLVDADPFGGGVDLVLGWEGLDGLRWPALAQTSGRVSPPALVEVLPRRGDLVVLSWDRGDLLAPPAEAMASALDAGRRGRDVVVVDLPRRLDDASVLALAAAQRGYLLVPAELRACAAAARVAAVARQHCPSLSVVVRGPAPGGLKAREVATALDLPLAGQLRAEPGLAGALERGEAPAGAGRGPLAALCQRLLGELTEAA
jgi:secretion/DNA translocation related CpaE-like protein